HLLSHEDPWKAMSIDEWLALRPLIRSPIPYFMIGLDDVADAYVKAGALPIAPKQTRIRPTALDELEIANLSLHSNYDLPLTEHSRLVMHGFGINTRTIRTRLVGPVNLTAHAGTITFVAGSSGCGKSVLLEHLDPEWRSSTIETRGQLK